MDLDNLILQSYQSAVALNQKASAELKHSLKTSERVPRFISRLKAELSRLPDNLLTADVVVSTTTDLTNLFLFQIEQAAKQKQMSSAERHRIETQMEKAKIINKAADTGEITDEVLDALKEIE